MALHSPGPPGLDCRGFSFLSLVRRAPMPVDAVGRRQPAQGWRGLKPGIAKLPGGAVSKREQRLGPQVGVDEGVRGGSVPFVG